MDFLLANWGIVLLAFFILEKIVKLSPTKADDIILDILWSSLKKVLGKGK